ncbi:MAG TPA: chorismate synthase [Myxococcota bacterium]|nr:chorismate synthase [Myxococcota bacterium]
MNIFGHTFRLQIFGESHAACVGVLIDGCPAGLAIDPGSFSGDLERRRGGSLGTTPRQESDLPRILSGVFEGRTNGSPILLVFENLRGESGAYESIRHTPRPGHADFVALKRFGGFADYRGGGHFSGRLTVGLVAAGVIAKMLIAPLTITSRILEVGGGQNIERQLAEAMAEGDSLGGVVECRAKNVPVGLGEPFFDSVESLLSHMVFSIGGVRGIEFGAGFKSARMRGSQCNDAILDGNGRTATNHAGGINGGLTNGNDIVFRVAVKPTSSIARQQETIDTRTGMPALLSVDGRHDACIALRLPAIIEAATAVVLADLMIEGRLVPRVLPAAEA